MQSVRKVLAVSTASCWQLVVFWPYGTHWCMQFYSIQLHSLFWITWFGFTANTSTVLLMNDDAALISRFHGVSTCLLNWACISHWKTRSSQLRASEDKVAEVSARVSGRCFWRWRDWLGIWPGTDTKDMTSEQKHVGWPTTKHSGHGWVVAINVCKGRQQQKQLKKSEEECRVA